MLRRQLNSIALLCAGAVLTGCANVSIPTGASEEKYLNPRGGSPIATLINSASYDPTSRSIYLDVSQYKLQQLYTVPKHFNTASGNVTLYYPDAKPKDDYIWEFQAISLYSVSQIREVSLTLQDGTPVVVPVKLENKRVELDLNDVIDKIRPNARYSVVCDSCTRAALETAIPLESFPALPRSSGEVNLVVLPAERSAIRNKLREVRQAAIAEQRAREAEAREREQRLAREQREREAQAKKDEADRKREAARIAREGDGSPDDLVCKKYGFKPNTDAYASCRLQVATARREMQQQRAMYIEQQRQIEQAQEAERKRRQSAFMLGMGLRMMGGQSAAGAAIDQSVGAPMYQSPPPSTRMYTLPNGRMMTCTTTGSMTNCF